LQKWIEVTWVMNTDGIDRKLQKLLKWVADRVLSAIALLLLSPLLLIIAIAIYISISSPILFTQQRPGKYGRIFTFCKFRTTTNDCDPDGNLLPDEQRLTALGQFLRQTSAVLSILHAESCPIPN